MNRMKLRAVNLSKKYKSGKAEVWALRDVNLEIKEGEFLAIIGPSGAGKSTLLHILGALDSPSSGEVVCRKVGFVFQFYHLLSEFTVLENVMMPAKIARFTSHASRHTLKEKAEELLKKLGLENRMHHRPSELSGGEQQRVAIARALINQPDVLLCDEPTGNLDSQNGERIIEILEAFNKQGRTLVIVSHEQKIAQRADRVLRMRDGRIEEEL